MGRRIATAVLVLVVLAAVAVGGAAAWGWARYVSPGPLAAPIAIVIPKGSGIAAIAALLERRGIIVDPLAFRLGVRLEGLDAALKAGEFEFPARVSAQGAAAVLKAGKTVVRRLTVAEGLTTAQVLTQLAATEGLEGLVVPHPPEGALLPETYHFSHGDTRAALVGRMRRAMDKTLTDLWETRAEGLPLSSPEEALVLASVVEKETGVPEERALVAGVFVNRLRKGMRLQSDPTVVYVLTEGQGALGRALTRKDLEVDSPYNTYRVKGLPPAPIANPGREAIAAVLRPAETDALYFVADGTGGHVFATTLREHNRNVAAWRKIKRNR